MADLVDLGGVAALYTADDAAVFALIAEDRALRALVCALVKEIGYMTDDGRLWHLALHCDGDAEFTPDQAALLASVVDGRDGS